MRFRNIILNSILMFWSSISLSSTNPSFLEITSASPETKEYWRQMEECFQERISSTFGDIDAKDGRGRTAFMVAVEGDDLASVLWLSKFSPGILLKRDHQNKHVLDLLVEKSTQGTMDHHKEIHMILKDLLYLESKKSWDKHWKSLEYKREYNFKRRNDRLLETIREEIEEDRHSEYSDEEEELQVIGGIELERLGGGRDIQSPFQRLIRRLCSPLSKGSISPAG